MLFYHVIESSIETIPLILIALLFRSFTKRISSSLNYRMWMLVFVRLLIPVRFKVNSSFPLIDTEKISDAVFGFTDFFDNNAYPPIYTEKSLPLFDLFMYIWITGIVLFFVYQFVNEVALSRKLRFMIYEKDNIYISDSIRVPFVHGLFSPKIYLPSKADENYREIALMHEQVHINRKDNLVKAVSCIMLGIHWFNVFVWIAYFLLLKDMEKSCDEIVLDDSRIDRKVYCEALLKTVHRPERLGIGFLDGGLKERITNIMNHSKPKKQAYIICSIVVGIVFVLFLFENGNSNYSSGFYKQTNLDPSKETAISSVSIRFTYPIDNPIITCGYDGYDGHKGIDLIEEFPGRTGNVYATAPGEVMETGYNEEDGWFVVIRHLNGCYSFYSHLSEVNVSVGDKVNGEIGTVGSTGNSEGIHLHFSMYDKNCNCIKNVSEILVNR